MIAIRNRSTIWIAPLAPVLVMVLAATAIPIELQPRGHFSLTFRKGDGLDVLENIVGYVPVGIVLAQLGPLRAIWLAAALSGLAETSQLFMAHRHASLVDVGTNTLGAALGALLFSKARVRPLLLRVDPWTVLLAGAVAITVALAAFSNSGASPSTHGSTTPGDLEAHWRFDEASGDAALDASGHGLNGHLRHHPKRVAGVTGGAIELDGSRDYVDFGQAIAFRLMRSMTISAWIRPSSFPVDDAAIVSNLDDDGFGYQLDTTVDRGARTIGFKLADACGKLMARYGKTTVVAGAWSHVAGVYDADSKTLHVYLNGQLDDGFLAGSVTGSQRGARAPLRVGRRGDSEEFAFAGSIDDVRIYSLALTAEQIARDLHGTASAPLPVRQRSVAIPPAANDRALPGDRGSLCVGSSDHEDARVPGMVAAIGVLLAVACAGFWSSTSPLLWAFASFAVGLSFPAIASPTMPAASRWMMPLVSLIGGLSVAVSVRRRTDSEH
jgi:hypothetical protein